MVRHSINVCFSSVVFGNEPNVNVRPLIVHHLVWQSDGRAADERALFVPPLQKIGQQFPFALHKDGPPPHKAEVVLLQDVVAFLHHLGEEGGQMNPEGTDMRENSPKLQTKI